MSSLYCLELGVELLLFSGISIGMVLECYNPRRLALACMMTLEREVHHRTKLPILFLDLTRICCGSAFKILIVVATEIRFDHFDPGRVGRTMNSNTAVKL